MKRLAVLVTLVTLLAAPAFAQLQLTQNDALAFDYDNAVFSQYAVTEFQVQWDSAGSWTTLSTQSFTDSSTTAGHTSYKFVPPFTNGNHSVSIRACNVYACGTGSAPFSFGYAVNSAPTASPTNFRKVPR